MTQTSSRTYVLVILCIATWFGITSSAHAATSIASFTASPTSIGHGLSTSLSWSIVEGSGATLTLECPDGVGVEKDGVAFECGKAASLSSSSGSAGFRFTNVSGSTATVLAKLTPKNSSGTALPEASATVSIAIGTMPQPLTEFEASHMTVESDTPVTFEWKGSGIPLTNMQFVCIAGVKIFDTGGAELPCGTRAFATDLPASGSKQVTFVNGSGGTVSVQAFMLPGLKAGVYDATHALQDVVSIKPKESTPPPQAVAFSISSNDVYPAEEIQLNWKTSNAKGANILISCEHSISIVLNNATRRCNEQVSASALPEEGTMSLSFAYSGYAQQGITVQLLVQDAHGVYANSPFTQYLTIYPSGFAKPSLAQFGAPTPTPLLITVSSSTALAATSTATTTAKLASKSVVQKKDMPESNLSPLQLLSQQLAKGELPQGIVLGASTSSIYHAEEEGESSGELTVGLYRGSQHPEVIILQVILMRDPEIYTAGITGYFGPKTEAAVQAFQEKHGIARPGDSGYGYVGPKTRAKLNEL